MILNTIMIIRRQGRLETYGIEFIRFTDLQIKKEMFSVLLALEQTIKKL